MTKKSMFLDQMNDSGQFRDDERLIGEIEAFCRRGMGGDTSQSFAAKVAARRRRRNAAEARQRARWLDPLFRIY
jgi:hypothetical protein